MSGYIMELCHAIDRFTQVPKIGTRWDARDFQAAKSLVKAIGERDAKLAALEAQCAGMREAYTKVVERLRSGSWRMSEVKELAEAASQGDSGTHLLTRLEALQALIPLVEEAMSAMDMEGILGDDPDSFGPRSRAALAKVAQQQGKREEGPLTKELGGIFGKMLDDARAQQPTDGGMGMSKQLKTDADVMRALLAGETVAERSGDSFYRLLRDGRIQTRWRNERWYGIHGCIPLLPATIVPRERPTTKKRSAK